MINFDTVIIGSSLGGCSAALTLAQQGKKVALIDMKSHPKAKACGAGLSRQGFDALFGQEFNIEGYPHRKLSGYAINHYGRRPVRIASFEGVGISRPILDRIIFDRLRTFRNLTILEGMVVKGIETRANNFQINGIGDELLGSSVILACGNNNKLKHNIGIPIKLTGTEQIGASIECETKMPIVDSYVHVHYLNDAAICVTPIDLSRINLSWISDPRSTASRDKIIKDIRSVALQYKADIEDSEILGAASIGARTSPCFHNGIFVVGDAVCQLDPIGGMGMSNAICSGKSAALAIIKLLNSNAEGIANINPNNIVIKRYKRNVSAIIGRNKVFTALASWGVRSRWSHNFLEFSQSSKFIQNLMISIHTSTCMGMF